ncbi:HTH-type transcriptional repressor FabR [Ferrimonas lipolytica]|uniref:HTH-type transcriptional repressor FabR n=1 Tax=Ferrimonas lipolytica TaxID=2724191 RepID=A0A6H1UHA3_9GAMM|nr:HTH-type transcriptional repressor FabR [Ferrimonas lipolytica]QIZ78424.1 HTH-type transcriptional repressor FabR [Ferrimonas lipolytica]
MGIRAQQKEKTRRALVDAAFNQLSAERSFSSLSLREVAREAGIAPTSFYRHFKDMEELGLTMVDEGGLTLRQLMRKGRQRAEQGGSIIFASMQIFMEFIDEHPNVFRLLLRERSGTSAAFRSAVNREIRHFTDELTDYLISRSNTDPRLAYAQAEAMVVLVFASGSEVLDMSKKERKLQTDRLILQVAMLSIGGEALPNSKRFEAHMLASQ